MTYKIGLLHTGVREDERIIIRKGKEITKVNIEPLDLRKIILTPGEKEKFSQFDLILQRCASTSRADQALWYFTEIGIPIVNNLRISSLCKNKFATNLRLEENKILTPRFAVAYTEEQVLEAINKIGGYPVVIKPVGGTSWGRLMGKLNDQDAVEMILEHKTALGVQHQSFYIQEYIDKPGRDIRAYLIGDKVLTAVYRKTKHWVTNTARGAKLDFCEVTKEMQEIGKQIAKAFGHGLLAIDFFESDKGLMVNEINHTMEFKNVVKKNEADISGEVIKFCVRELEK
jgi:[lysine-biosynthesis-protein LysW]--L-2-aminoadipate ligase